MIVVANPFLSYGLTFPLAAIVGTPGQATLERMPPGRNSQSDQLTHGGQTAGRILPACSLYSPCSISKHLVSILLTNFLGAGWLLNALFARRVKIASKMLAIF